MVRNLKLGYGTYGMRDEDVFTALPQLRDIGYEAIELGISDGWPTAPARLDASARARLADLCQSLDFPPPVLLGLPPGDDPADAFAAACKLANDLNFSAGPAVVCSMVPGWWNDWNAQKETMCEALSAWADIARESNVLLAVEPHVGTALDTPDKADWLMRRAAHPHLKLNFDYSHFYVQGIDLQHSVDLCMPHAAHLHIKDGRMVDDEVEFLLPGAGALDLASFMSAVRQTGTALPVTVEVSGHVWNAPGYDCWAAAESCYAALDAARRG